MGAVGFLYRRVVFLRGRGLDPPSVLGLFVMENSDSDALLAQKMSEIYRHSPLSAFVLIMPPLPSCCKHMPLQSEQNSYYSRLLIQYCAIMLQQ